MRDPVLISARFASLPTARPLELSGGMHGHDPAQQDSRRVVCRSLRGVVSRRTGSGIRRAPGPTAASPASGTIRTAALPPRLDDGSEEAIPPDETDRSRATRIPFAGPPGLSEEAIKSFRDIPPGSNREEDLMNGGAFALPDEAPPPPRPSRAVPQSPARPAAAKAQKRPEYVVEPPDMLLVEVLETLARPADLGRAAGPARRAHQPGILRGRPGRRPDAPPDQGADRPPPAEVHH